MSVDNQAIDNSTEISSNKLELLGMISVQYNRETREFFIAVPMSKDLESKQFLYNLIDELHAIVDPDGMEN